MIKYSVMCIPDQDEGWSVRQTGVFIALRIALRLSVAATFAFSGFTALAQPLPQSRPLAVAVSGDVSRSATLDEAALKALPSTVAKAGPRTYTGVSLWSVLNAAGPLLDATRRNPLVSMYVVATGEDGYKAVFSLAELDPALGNRNVLVAYAQDGDAANDATLPRLVVPDDLKPSRAVFRLTELRVFKAQ